MTPKRIVCIGCSWTDGFGDHGPDQTYPHIIKEQNPDWEVYNLGLRGTNNHFINLITAKAIDQLKPDFVIRQVTNFNRGMYYDPYYNIGLHYTITNEPGYYVLDAHRYIENIPMWTISGLSHPYKELLSSQEIRQRNQLWEEYYNVMSNGFSNEIEDAALYKARGLLENTPHMMLFWLDNKISLSSNLLWDTYPCVERDLGFAHIVDDGKHFLREGNQKLVNEILMPEIKRYV